MKTSQARVETQSASRYIAQLCKHFAHKITVEYDEHEGRANFAWGVCLMKAEPDSLTLHCEAPDEESLARVQYVVDDHLTRFAWRENVKINWTEA